MKSLALALFRGYKRWISPSFPPSCRYVPTCSEYAMEAVERYGVLRGGIMAAARVLRCHPLARGGLDPVLKNAAHSAVNAALPEAGKWKTRRGSRAAAQQESPAR